MTVTVKMYQDRVKEVLNLTDDNDRLRKALEEIVNPLSALKKRAEADGNRLSGQAYSICNDVGYLKNIARAALAQLPSGRDTLALGDIVCMNERAPYFYEWRGIELKVVSLRVDPTGKHWVSVVDNNEAYPPHHRGNGVYDGETTDIDAEHLSALPTPGRGGGV